MLSAVIILVLATVTSAQNDFDGNLKFVSFVTLRHFEYPYPLAILGCKQYTINRPAYNSPNPYFALDQFQDVREVAVAGLKIQSIKLAIMGSNDGVIRLSPVDQPYQNTLMDEIGIVFRL